MVKIVPQIAPLRRCTGDATAPTLNPERPTGRRAPQVRNQRNCPRRFSDFMTINF